jgi:hypothetical protein
LTVDLVELTWLATASKSTLWSPAPTKSWCPAITSYVLVFVSEVLWLSHTDGSESSPVVSKIHL